MHTHTPGRGRENQERKKKLNQALATLKNHSERNMEGGKYEKFTENKIIIYLTNPILILQEIFSTKNYYILEFITMSL